MATRRQILLGALGAAAAPYLAHLEPLAERLEVLAPVTPEAVYCGGLVDYISTNVTTVGGNLTREHFERFLRDVQNGAYSYRVPQPDPVSPYWIATRC